jgi:hypothetical protein
MKQIITSLILLLSIPQISLAQKLEATSIQDLVYEIESSVFQYKGRGMIFGFSSIQSCLYVSENITIIKNYCFPAKKYPARGMTILSKKFGMIDLYEEQLQAALKRDIQITEFPEIIGPYLSTPFPEMTINGLSSMIEKLYNQFNPACWSTNHSYYQEAPEATCHPGSSNVVNFDSWSEETQAITNDLKSWHALMDTINEKLK